MKNLIAKIESNANLSNRAKFVNNCRNDDSYFYVNGNQISISNPYREISEEDQLKELIWFIGSSNFTIEKQ
jgi:hypothetical protein